VSLPAGTKLGPYEVLSLLGAGGMGEVYRARDTRLDRTVAVKILRSGLTTTSDLRARFEREARAISHLTHPNICALYDVGNQDGSEYLVMEYVEGETLADKIARGPLPLSLVLRYGAQIAEALHHAHRSGIAHRDLKPGNVMITSSGAKLLDFGLAKFVVEPAHVFSDQSAPETMRPLTNEGAIVGTYQYMSPEQLHGTAVDHRSDIFSLGIVLYEMTAGQRPFPATSSASLIAAILSADPIPLRSLQPAAPPALERIILTALEKNPEERWQTAQDVARQLRWLAESSPSMEASAIPAATRRRLFHPAVTVAAAVAAALLTYAATKYSFSSQATTTQAHLQFVPPQGMSASDSPESPNFALSPDGKTLCFVGREGSVRALQLRALDSPVIRKLEGTESASGPFWSSDGRWIGYSAGGKLWKVSSSGGGVPQPLCDVALSGAIGSWNANTILFADRSGGREQIYRVADSGGSAVQLKPLKANEWRHSWPLLLPDGRHYLYQAALKGSIERQLLLGTLEGSQSTVLLRNVSQVALLSGDRLAYVRDGKLMAQRFDAGQGVVLGEPALLAEDVSYFYLSARAKFSAANGVIVYLTDKSKGQLTLMNRNGQKARTVDDTGVFYDVALSRDGKRAAATVTSRAGMGDIWIYDLARGVKDRFTSEPGFELHAVWAPDGRSIVYSDAPGGVLPHIVRRSLSSATSENLMPPGPFQFAGSFTSDSSTLFYGQMSKKTNEDVLRYDMKTGASEPVLVTGASEEDPQVSPDGQWLAFTSDASGNVDIYLVNLSNHAERIRISPSGGSNPRWRGDGGELFYLSDEKRIMRAVPKSAGDWSDVRTEELFAAPPNSKSFAVSPDGQSFLIMETTLNPSDAFFNVVLGQ
jgi:eukaryotic-like serine/threonine-protein kinase